MKLTELALKKPVSMTMIYLAILLIAVYAVNHIPLSLLPDLSYPRLTIVSLWRDASPEEVEANITAQIEAVGGTIPGIVNIKSTSSRERSVVNLEFTRNTDMEFARFELNEKLQLLKDILPDDVNPRIQPFLPREFRETEFLQYGLSGDYQTEELNKILEKKFKFRISALEGVSAFEISGYRDKIIKVIVDPPEITGITPAQVEEKIREHGKRVSVTGLDDDGLSKILIIEDHYRELAELKKLELVNAQKLPVTLGEIARFEQVFNEPFQLLRHNGSPQLVMTIQKEPDANAIRLARQIKNIVNEQSQNLSADLELIILEDEAREITSDLNVLMQRGIFSLMIIFIVLLLFLRKISSTALIILTIFFSSALTLILMFYLKIGLNMLSLAGLALGFGMMVDNSIVVYENIYRYLQKGIPAFRAALQGVREVALPISASTLTTVIVFAPFLYLHGDLKTFYLPFVYAMILSLISSLFVSFTFIPLAALKISASGPDDKIPVKISHYDPELTFYQKILKFLLRFRWIWTVIIVFLLAVTIWIFINKIEKGFVWTFPSDDYLGIQISLPVGSNINQTDSVARMFEDKILSNQLDLAVKTRVWTTYAYLRIDFPESLKSTVEPLVIREKLKAFAANFGNTRIFIFGFGPSFGGSGFSTANFSIELQGYYYEELKKITEELADYLQETNRRVQNIDTNATGWWKEDKLYEYQISFDRDKLAAGGVDVRTIIAQIFLQTDNERNSLTRKIAGKEEDIFIHLAEFDQYDISNLREMIVYNNSGNRIKLSDVGKIEKIEIMPEIVRENELYERRINFDFRGSYKKGRQFVESVIADYVLPQGYNFVEEKEDFSKYEDKKQLLYLLVFAVLLVYMSLGALFESLKYPLIILLILPLAFIGVTGMYYFFNEVFGSSSRIGLVLLAGIVVNNSIILIDHLNFLRKCGLDIMQAILQGMRDRIRPIMMTSLTTIMALIPMLFQTRTGKNEFWRLLSLSTIGGLLTSTFFVLTFIPIIYYLLTKTGDR